jgi:transcriptional regulator with XRE-family HTH domain
MANPNQGQREAGRVSAMGTLLRQLRRERGLTLAELASRIPMSASNLSRLELGRQRPPSDEVIERIADALAVEPGRLLAAAGRSTRGAKDFESAVLERLDAISKDVQDLRRSIQRPG